MSIDVVCATDAAFVTPTIVVIGSVLRHVTDPSAARVFVVDGGIDARGRLLLEQYGSAVGAELEILAIPTEMSVPKSATGHLSTATYLRLLAPRLVPGDVTRLLYLDGDVLVVDALDALQSVDLGGRAVGAVRDFEVPLVSSPGGIADWRRRGLDPSAAYVNAGVLVIDVARWREVSLGEWALDDQRRHSTVTGDQGSLNAVAQGEIALLDPRWNAQASLLHLDLFAPSPHKEALLRRRDELIDRPAIVHFVGPHKPWHPTCRHPAAVEWRRHAARVGSLPLSRPVTSAATSPPPAASEHATLSVVLPWERGATVTDGDLTVTVTDAFPDVEVVVATVVGESPPTCRARLVRSVDAGQDTGIGDVWRAGCDASAGSAVLFAPAGVDVSADVVATVHDAFARHRNAGALLMGADGAAERTLGWLELLDLLQGSGSLPAPEQIVFRRNALRDDDFAVDLLDGFIDMHLLLAVARRAAVITVPVSAPRRTSARPWPERRYAALAGSHALAAREVRLRIGLERLRSMLPARPSVAFVEELTATARALEEATAELVPLLGTTPQQRRARLGTLLARAVDPRAVVAFADDDMWCPETIGGFQVVPFPSIHGVFAGLPASDKEALSALGDARARGLDHLGFPASSRWWLTHYPALGAELRRSWAPVVDDPALIVFALQERLEQSARSS